MQKSSENQNIIVQLCQVYKSFGEKHVLKGLNLDIRKGESFVILGPSGCGKSVTIKLITGLLPADAGKICYNGQDISILNYSQLAEIRKKIGMLFQNAALFDSLTVGENVAFGLRKHHELTETEINTRVCEALSMVGLEGTEDKMPSELSGGMRKRAGLARAIVLKPDVIFYDEPTTGLDPIMASEIDHLIIKLQKELNCTSIIITHDLNSAFRIADRIGLHWDGKIWETATPEKFVESQSPMVQQFLHGKSEGPIRV